MLSLVNPQTGEVRSQVIPDVTGATLRKVIADQADLSSTTVVTDEWKGYRPMRAELAGHQTVNHSADEYMNDEGFTPNHAEG